MTSALWTKLWNLCSSMIGLSSQVRMVLASFAAHARAWNRCAVAGKPKICAIGPATAKAVNEVGLAVALIPESFVAEGVLEALEKYHGGLQTLQDIVF